MLDALDDILFGSPPIEPADIVEQLEDRGLHPDIWVLDAHAGIDVVGLEGDVFALTDVRFFEVYLEGGEVALFDEELALRVLGNTYNVVGVIRE